MPNYHKGIIVRAFGSLLIITLLFNLAGCSTSAPVNQTGIATATIPAPEIEETNLSAPERQSPSTAGSPLTKDVDIAKPPLISLDTIDCALQLLIEKECAGFQLGDSKE